MDTKGTSENVHYLTVPLDAWIAVSTLARAEHDCTKRQVYYAIDHGMRHSRVATRIRVRRVDWHEWHEANVQGGQQ